MEHVKILRFLIVKEGPILPIVEENNWTNRIGQKRLLLLMQNEHIRFDISRWIINIGRKKKGCFITPPMKFPKNLALTVSIE